MVFKKILILWYHKVTEDQFFIKISAQKGLSVELPFDFLGSKICFESTSMNQSYHSSSLLWLILNPVLFAKLQDT